MLAWAVSDICASYSPARTGRRAVVPSANSARTSGSARSAPVLVSGRPPVSRKDGVARREQSARVERRGGVAGRRDPLPRRPQPRFRAVQHRPAQAGDPGLGGADPQLGRGRGGAAGDGEAVLRRAQVPAHRRGYPGAQPPHPPATRAASNTMLSPGSRHSARAQPVPRAVRQYGAAGRSGAGRSRQGSPWSRP
jgi:hypothetical protein